MPKYYDEHYESTEQDFEPVFLTKKKSDNYTKKEPTLGEQIKLARQRKAISQLKLARELKVKQDVIDKIETGKIIPTKQMCKRINQICCSDFKY